MRLIQAPIYAHPGYIQGLLAVPGVCAAAREEVGSSALEYMPQAELPKSRMGRLTVYTAWGEGFAAAHFERELPFWAGPQTHAGALMREAAARGIL